MLLVPLLSCGPDEGYTFGKNEYQTTVGKTVTLDVEEYDNQNHGCQCDPPDMVYTKTTNVDFGVEPTDGAYVDRQGRFTATKPGSYTVTAYGRLGSASTTVVVAGDDVANQEDTEGSGSDGTGGSEGDAAQSVDTADAIEVFGTHSDAPVNAGDPPNPTVFTWSWNEETGGMGVTIVMGVPQP